MEQCSEMTVDQVEECREMFCHFDSNGDGAISTAELAAIMRSMGHNPTEAEIQDLVNSVDHDGNGTLDCGEFVELIAKTMKQADPERELREAFKTFDKDDNGYITPAELRYVMNNMGEKLTEKEAVELIKDVDTDGDGLLSFEDFTSMMEQYS